nr:MAG TPA: hypothetical protein [Caudoviricetes sp.]
MPFFMVGKNLVCKLFCKHVSCNRKINFLVTC